MSVEEVNALVKHPTYKFSHLGTYLYASNSRTVARRAEKHFEYVEKAPSLWNTLEADYDACDN